MTRGERIAEDEFRMMGRGGTIVGSTAVDDVELVVIDLDPLTTSFGRRMYERRYVVAVNDDFKTSGIVEVRWEGE